MDNPFRLLHTELTGEIPNQRFTLRWNSFPGLTYQLFASPDLQAWQPVGDLLTATQTISEFTTAQSSTARYFSVERK